MNCKTCYYWLHDDVREKSMRGYCRNSRADKSANRTVFDYSCREYAAQQNAHTDGACWWCEQASNPQNSSVTVCPFHKPAPQVA